MSLTVFTRIRLILYVITGCLVFFSQNIRANNLPAYTTELTNVCNSSQAFVQTLELKENAKPFLIKGTVTYRCHRFIRWQTQSPYPSESYFDKKSFYHTFHFAGKEYQFEMNPKTVYANDILWSLMFRDFSYIYGNYRVNAVQKNNRWYITLQPKTARLMSMIDIVHIQGREFIEDFQIRYTSGDHLRLSFSALSSQAEQ